MLPQEKVQNLIDRHLKLEKELSSGEIDKKKYAEISKEYSDLNDIIKQAKEYLSFKKDTEDLNNIINDKNSDLEMKEFANSELENLKNNYQINEKIKLFLLPKDLADSKNAIIEVRAGTGGLEASLFASDLYKMYEKVCQKKWVIDVISISKSDAGGLKEIIALIKGKNIYSSLKYESGVHRVQKFQIPKHKEEFILCSYGCSFAEAEDLDIKLDEKDLRIDVFRSSGPGGQSVNTTDSAVRITHLPTGIVVSQQDEKSQIRNKEKGLKILRSRIYDYERHDDQERSKDRKSKIGTGDRSERIRTYNFPQEELPTIGLT